MELGNPDSMCSSGNTAGNCCRDLVDKEEVSYYSILTDEAIASHSISLLLLCCETLLDYCETTGRLTAGSEAVLGLHSFWHACSGPGTRLSAGTRATTSSESID